MLARAVVVERRGLAAGAGEALRRRCARGPVRAAFQGRLGEAGLGQHGRGGLGVARLAGMRGTGQRQFRMAEAIAVGGSALDQRQGLQRLDGRARIDRLLDVADREDDAACRVANHRAPRWTHSTLSPRRTSTRIGSVRDMGRLGVTKRGGLPIRPLRLGQPLPRRGASVQGEGLHHRACALSVTQWSGGTAVQRAPSVSRGSETTSQPPSVRPQ